MAYDKEELVSSVLGKMSLNGMRAVTANAVEISAVSSALIEGRVKPFLKQVELTERYRGMQMFDMLGFPHLKRHMAWVAERKMKEKSMIQTFVPATGELSSTLEGFDF